MFCPNCGGELPAEGDCPSCGQARPSLDRPQRLPAATPPPSKTLAWLGCGLGGVLIGILVTIAAVALAGLWFFAKAINIPK